MQSNWNSYIALLNAKCKKIIINAKCYNHFGKQLVIKLTIHLPAIPFLSIYLREMFTWNLYMGDHGSYICICMLSHFSCVWLFVTLWTAAPLSMEFSRQEYWSGLSCSLQRDLPNPGIEPATSLHLLHWQAGSLPLTPLGKPSFICNSPIFTLQRVNG